MSLSIPVSPRRVRKRVRLGSVGANGGGNVRGRRRAIVGGAGGVDGRLGGRCEALCDEFDRADVFAAVS